MTVARRVDEARRRIGAAAARAGRRPEEVTLLAATKGRSERDVEEARAAGVTDFGENRVADLVERVAALPELRWRMIGRLQTNKVRRLPPGLAAIHSVDRASLVERLAGHRAPAGPDLYVEVAVAGEETKGGVAVGDLPGLLDAMAEAGLRPIGLMTMAPMVSDPEEVRPVFRALARLAEQHALSGLSMGMSDDFEVAVEEGATVVRLGRALFGPPLP